MVRCIILLVMISLTVLTSCKTPSQLTRSTVSEDLKQQTGFDIAAEKKNGRFDLPPSVQPADGISEEEAVSLALWNNAQLQADLITIHIAEADVIDAGVVSNPLLRYLAPSGAIMASGYINFGLDFLFQRPKRIATAQVDLQRVAQTMLQKSYTLIKDVQVAYTDVLLAKERVSILAENAQVRLEMAQLANSRLRNGDISELEVSTFRADSAAAVDDLVKATLDTLIKKNILNVLLGFSPDTTIHLQTVLFSRDSQQIVPVNYLSLADSYQPDIKAAAIAIESAGKRLGWERSRILAFTGTLNFQHLPANGGSKWLPNAANPGIQLEIPILNRNQGKIARAKADLELAAFQYTAARQRVALDAAIALDRYEQNWQSYIVWNTKVLPSLSEAVRLSQSSYTRGDISYLPVLEAMRQLLNGRLRRAEIQAEIRKSVSNLNYFIGNKWNR